MTTTFQAIEADILAFIVKVENAVEVLIADAESALSNVAAMVPTITADIAAVVNFVEGMPVVGSNPSVMAAVAATDLAVKGLDAFAASYNQATSGGSITITQATQAVVAGYQDVKTAQAAAATATATAVGATSVAAAPSATAPPAAS